MNSIKAFITVLTYYLLYYYLERFETLSCDCGYDIRRDMLKTMILMFYILIFGKLVFVHIPPSIVYCIILYTLMFDVLLFSYVHKLNSAQCRCFNTSQDFMTTFIYYYYLLILLLLVSSIFLSVLFISIPK